ncbi:MAG: hypothetical protein J6Q55_03945, partial [Clostridia bacterium]|nr:hypothetical protein [Clostridia bacterium]
DASTLPNFNQAGRYAVKVVYQGNEFSFGIEVYSPIEIKADTTVKYVRGDDVSKYVQMREVNADGTATEWYGVGQTDVTRCEIVDGKLYVGVDLLVNNVTYGGEYVFDVDNTAISVNQLLQNQASDETYTVNGIVIAIATAMTRDEVIIADKTTGDVIGVSGLAVSGKVSSRTLEIDLEVGDEVILPVKLAVSDADSEAGKLYAQYQGGIFAFLSVVSKNNDKKLDYSNAQVITNQTELKALLGSSASRIANINKVVKLSGELKFTLYSSSRHIRFWFGDANVKDLTTQKIDGVSPCFCDGTQLYTTGATFSEQILGDANWANTSFTAPDVRHLNIYAMYIGGNGYYHEFVILRTEDVTPIEAQLTGQTFTPPTTTQYMKGSTLDLTGAKIVREYDIKEAETIPVTMDMLDATSFDMATAGTQTVRGSYQGYDFSFDILIFAKEVTGIEIVSQPTKTTYTHRDGLATLDLTGGKVRVNYSDATYEDFDMDASMLPPTDENWALGTVNYTVTYYGCTTTLAITYENTALTISQVLQKTPDPSSTKEEDIAKKTFYEVTGVVVGPATSYAAAELLIKEKTSNKILGVWSASADVVGSYNGLKLNTNIINIGDEITFYASLEVGASDSTSYGMRDKVFLRCQNSDLRNASLKIVSRGNSTNITLTDSDVTVISDATSLKAFLASPTRYYSYVKFVNVQAYQADASNYNLCYDKKAINVANVPARVSLNNVSNFKSYFSGTPTTSASGAVETTNDFYMLFLGGNSKAHHFTILQSDWVLPRA